MTLKTALVLGAGGFIGNHMVTSLKESGYFVRGVDIKRNEYSESTADEFILYDLTDQSNFYDLLKIENHAFDEIYQFAADMGGAGFIFTGDNDADIMTNSSLININLLNFQRKLNENLSINKTKIFYSSSACIYPEFNQLDPNNPNCKEDSAFPADTDSEYGWEKLYSERLFLAYKKNFDMDIKIARYHNIYGPFGTYDGGREKAPAAICRKVALAEKGGEIEIWGDGEQTRSFLYIDECIKATRLLVNSEYTGPYNIGSEEMVTINELVSVASKISKNNVTIKHIDGPLGVRGRNSDNDLIRKDLGWDNSTTLQEGLTKTYNWIKSQIEHKNITYSEIEN